MSREELIALVGEQAARIAELEASLARLKRPRSTSTESMSVAAHTAIVSAVSELKSAGPATPGITAYARNAAPRHHLAAGDSAGALATLFGMNTHPGQPTTVIGGQLAARVRATARRRSSRHPSPAPSPPAAGGAGDVAGAVAGFEALLTAQLRVLGADHPDTLRTRNNLAHWRGRAGDAGDDSTV